VEIRSIRGVDTLRVHTKQISVQPNPWFKALSFPLFRPFKALKSPPADRGSARGGRHAECVSNYRLTVVFEPCAGDVAQLGERLPCTQGVTGSSPVISTSTLSTE
jgi:hypothetical protein